MDWNLDICILNLERPKPVEVGKLLQHGTRIVEMYNIYIWVWKGSEGVVGRVKAALLALPLKEPVLTMWGMHCIWKIGWEWCRVEAMTRQGSLSNPKCQVLPEYWILLYIYQVVLWFLLKILRLPLQGSLSAWHPGQQQIIYKTSLWGICADRARKLSTILTCLWRGLSWGNKCWPSIILGGSYCKKNLMDGGREVGRDLVVAGMHGWTH